MERPRSATSARQHTGERQQDDVWRAIRVLEERLLSSPFTGGRLITHDEADASALPQSGIPFDASQTRSIPHKLGRKVTGFVELYGARVVTGSPCSLRPVPNPDADDDAEFLTVQALSAGRCFILVF
jgi:hypothetical protein